jgi:hypothetical protein
MNLVPLETKLPEKNVPLRDSLRSLQFKYKDIKIKKL